MKPITFLVVTLSALISAAIQAPAQIAVPPPAPAVQLRSPAELDQMLGSIALYPDPLIAQILPAATLPSEVVLANRYVSSGGDVNQIDGQPWDPSIKALARYPNVLKMMDDNLAWTTDLGQAFINQPADVMDSIQRLRAQAQTLGNLQTTPQQQVVVDDGEIEIVPADPEVIYVPFYQPDFIFGRRGFFLSFGGGFRIGGWLNHDFDWHNHHVIVWRHDNPRPRDWWYHPGNQRPGPRPGGPNVGVWRPRSRPSNPAANRSDRGWDVHENHPVVVPHETRPAPTRIESRPVQPFRPAAPVQRPTGGALIGIDNTHDTHEFSNRGGQSRQTISRPAPAPHSFSPAPSHGAGGSDPRKR